MNDVYMACPKFENEHITIRLLCNDDVNDLLKVYSDTQAVPFFNSDNCHGDDFYYPSLEKMQKAVDFWQYSYNEKYFVRFSIIDKRANNAVVGTIELFHREAQDFYTHCGLLRLDLRSDYEKADFIAETLGLILPAAYELFHCDMIATKAVEGAGERIQALSKLGFQASEKPLIGGQDGKEYYFYFCIYRKHEGIEQERETCRY
jgi:RimJ/RimL family protein N-acetyltransferase